MPTSPVTRAVYAAAADVCTVGWQDAVASRVASTVGDQLWDELDHRRRERGMCAALCVRLAELANEIDKAAVYVGNMVGGAIFGIPRQDLIDRFVLKIAQAVTAKIVTKAVNAKTAVVTRSLRIIGIWLCFSEGDLDNCPCFRDFAKGQTKAWVQAELKAELRDLAPAS
jgi:hypothetical protein